MRWWPVCRAKIRRWCVNHEHPPDDGERVPEADKENDVGQPGDAAFISRTLNELTKANEDTFSFFSALWIDGARLLQKVDEK